jgi:hypothetical protein
MLATMPTRMADPHTRRAFGYRHRAQELAGEAEHVRDEADRRHLLDMAATYQRGRSDGGVSALNRA